MFDESGSQGVILRTIGRGTRFHTVRLVPSTGSTNADLCALAREGFAEGVVIVADEQTAGRGRRDRVWSSPAGSSIAMSLLLRPDATATDWGWLSLLAGIGVVRAIRQVTGAGERITLKWPNDVLLDGGKVSGILSERVETTSGPAAVVGIGINLSLDRESLPVPQATSLALAGLTHERDAVVDAILRSFDSVYTRWLSDGPPLEEYRQLCASIGEFLTVTVSDTERIEGFGCDIDPLGRLVVEVGRSRRSFAVGDVVHAGIARPARS